VQRVSHIEQQLSLQMRAAGVPEPVHEYRFHPVRKWRFDFAWPDRMLAAECEGGTAYGRSRHSRGSGFDADCEKYNTALLLGWRVLRFSGAMVDNGEALQTIEQALGED
jgi:very-short-patch-repair endonuclease